MVNPTPAPVPDPGTLVPSYVRTLIPMLAGVVANWLLQKLGLYDVDNTLLAGLIVAGFGWLYYVVVRALEVYASDNWGYILGFRRKPVYPAGTTPGVAPNPGERGAVDVGGLAYALLVLGVVLLAIGYLATVPVLVTLGWVALVVGVVLFIVSVATSRRV